MLENNGNSKFFIFVNVKTKKLNDLVRLEGKGAYAIIFSYYVFPDGQREKLCVIFPLIKQLKCTGPRARGSVHWGQVNSCRSKFSELLSLMGIHKAISVS